MITYIVLYIIAFVLFIYSEQNRNNKHKESFAIFCLLIFACISAFRYNLGGSDYELYQINYNNIATCQSLQEALNSSFYEIGYTVFVFVCSHFLHLTSYGYFAFEAFFFYAVMYIGLKRYVDNWGVFLMMFLYKMFFYQTFISMRQSITVCAFFIIMRFIEEKKPIKYYLSLITCVLPFHYGSILLTLLYPITNLVISKKRLKIFGLLMGATLVLSEMTASLPKYIVSIFGLTALEDKAIGYSADTNLSLFYTIEYFLLYYLVVKNYTKIKQLYHKTDFIIKLFLIVLPIVTLFRSTLILVRVIPYFYPAYAILFYYVYKVNNNKGYLLFYISLCLYGLIRYIILFDNGCMIPYISNLFISNVHYFQ